MKMVYVHLHGMMFGRDLCGKAVKAIFILHWRIEGTEGVAKGTIGWPFYPTPTPSTFDFTTVKHPGKWFKPRWNEVWFPDAFAGPMAQLMCAIEENNGTGDKRER